MKLFNKVLALGAIALLAACATAQDYDNMLNKYMGASQAEIIKKFGAPSAVKIINDNTTVLAYTNVDNVFVPSEYYTYAPAGELYGQDGVFYPFLNDYDFDSPFWSPGYEVEYVCKTVFLLQNDKVTAWKWQGNNCVASDW